MDKEQHNRQQVASNGESTAEYHGSLGVELANQGKIEEAILEFRKAVALAPGDINAHYCLGTMLSRQGLLDKAIGCFKTAVELQPDHFDSLYNMANALQGQNRFDAAIETYHKAISLNPGHAAAYSNLGNTLKQQGRLSQAALSYQQGISADPAFVNGYYNLGVLQIEQGQQEDAIVTFKQGLAVTPDHPALLCNLGLAYRELGLNEDAVSCYRKALEFEPNFPEALNNLGNALQDMGQLEEAVDCLRLAISMTPENVETHINLGKALLDLGKLQESETVSRRCLKLDPTLADAHFNLGIVLLRTGRLPEGWQEYEWRWQSRRFQKAPRHFSQPKWDGSSLAGKKILLWAEQGLGDEVRYASMIPDVLATGVQVTIECNDRLAGIFARSFKETTVRPALLQEADTDLDCFDFQCSLASLGQFFRNDTASFNTNSMPYLSAAMPLVKRWKTRLGDIDECPKIGISWNSAVAGRDTFNASIAELEPILSMPNVRFVNLQSHDSRPDIERARKLYGVEILDWEDLDLRNDLENVAALTSALDLVISFPTFSAEFAGALGVPTLCFHSEKTSLDLLGTGESVWQPKIQYFAKNTRDEHWHRIFVEIAQTAQEMLKNIVKT